jgi:hypothetical protein
MVGEEHTKVSCLHTLSNSCNFRTHRINGGRQGNSHVLDIKQQGAWERSQSQVFSI